MTDSGRYPTTPIGQELGQFFDHRTVLRRTVPLFSISWQDFTRYMKGEAAMVHPTEHKDGSSHGGGHDHSRRQLHAHA
ncbi:MAG TPA: hypothetical protein VHK04_03090 [Castellaniella sp.]|nr:hypothetical protein [Castellaniella sp.]